MVGLTSPCLPASEASRLASLGRYGRQSVQFLCSVLTYFRGVFMSLVPAFSSSHLAPGPDVADARGYWAKLHPVQIKGSGKVQGM